MKLYFIKDDLFAKTKEQIIQYMIENVPRFKLKATQLGLND